MRTVEVQFSVHGYVKQTIKLNEDCQKKFRNN